jgi:hypothetical protein
VTSKAFFHPPGGQQRIKSSHFTLDLIFDLAEVRTGDSCEELLKLAAWVCGSESHRRSDTPESPRTSALFGPVAMLRLQHLGDPSRDSRHMLRTVGLRIQRFENGQSLCCT